MKICSNLAQDRVDVLLRRIETREMRVYVARVGRAIEDRPGWIRLTAKEWGDRPGVDRDYRPAIGPKYSPGKVKYSPRSKEVADGPSGKT